MKTIDDCVSAKKALEEALAFACAKRDKLIQLKPPESSLFNIQSWEDAIDQYEARLTLLPQAMKHRRELLDENLDAGRRKDVLALIAAEPCDLCNSTYTLNMLG